MESQREEMLYSKLNKTELNPYPYHWLIYTTIMLLIYYVVFNLKTRGFSWTDVPLLSLTTLIIFIKYKKMIDLKIIQKKEADSSDSEKEYLSLESDDENIQSQFFQFIAPTFLREKSEPEFYGQDNSTNLYKNKSLLKK